MRKKFGDQNCSPAENLEIHFKEFSNKNKKRLFLTCTILLKANSSVFQQSHAIYKAIVGLFLNENGSLMNIKKSSVMREYYDENVFLKVDRTLSNIFDKFIFWIIFKNFFNNILFVYYILEL